MPNPAFASLPLLLLLAVPSAGDVPPQTQAPALSLDGTQLAQLYMQQWVVVRVTRGPAPVAAPPRVPAPAPDGWREKHAAKCVKTERVAGAQIVRQDAIDLMLANGKRLRAKLNEDCPALAFYAGFYIKPEKDGKVCAERDSIRLRSGGSCRISEFRELVAEN